MYCKPDRGSTHSSSKRRSGKRHFKLPIGGSAHRKLVGWLHDITKKAEMEHGDYEPTSLRFCKNKGKRGGLPERTVCGVSGGGGKSEL